MPIYEYECPKCGRVEVIQKVSEASSGAAIECPNDNCGCKAQRVISASAFHLKGSGWYKTDYTSSSSSGGSGNSSTKPSAEAAPTSSSDSSTDGGSKEKKSLKTTGGGGCGSGCGCH